VPKVPAALSNQVRSIPRADYHQRSRLAIIIAVSSTTNRVPSPRPPRQTAAEEWQAVFETEAVNATTKYHEHRPHLRAEETQRQVFFKRAFSRR
jgi:hypothetical protein